MTELTLRFGIFTIVLSIMMIWEACRPNRISPVPKKRRWTSNFVLVICGALVAKLLLPAGLAAIAFYAQHNNLGLLNTAAINNLQLPFWLIIVLSVMLLDLIIYWQHRLFHKVPLLWTLHQVHHADPHLDASTGLRFHPLEIAVSLIIKVLAVLTFGVPAEAILIFEIILNATSIFNHANISLNNEVEKRLRAIIVTQAMHRIHHSQNPSETDSNFSFNLSVWDRLFASYTKNAEGGDSAIQLGLKEYPSEQSNTNLKAILLMPFKRAAKPKSES